MTRIVCLAIATLLLMLGQPRVTVCSREHIGVQNFAEVNGTRLSYESVGQGPAVILIHGGLNDSRLWDDQMNDFSKQYESCVVINGASHHPPVEKPKQFNKIVLNFIRNAREVR